ncbi:MAG: lysozyme inhibitor LprI family protein [Candidatus Moraniibacteriota bacterium]
MFLKWALPFVVLVTYQFCSAQEEDNTSDFYATATNQHNTEYILACQKATPPEQEALIRAELAWTDFSDKEKSLANALESGNLISSDYARWHGLAVVDARTAHLRSFFIDYNINYPPQYTPENRDRVLNETYAKFMLRMPKTDQALLRSSETAWIAYRDADIAAARAGSDSPKWRDAALIQLAETRIEEIASMMQALSQATLPPVPAQAEPSPPPQGELPAPGRRESLGSIPS